jgi:5-methylcytosine-specific restriction endonuclease McrA
MIREVTNWRWVEDSGRVFRLYVPKKSFISDDFYAGQKFKLEYLSDCDPIHMGKDFETHKKRYWLYKGKLYWENDNLDSDQLKLLLDDKLEKQKKKIERLKMKEGAIEIKREPIPEKVKIFVWNRDHGKCVKCGSQVNLEYDHIIPISKGGSNTARNIQLLCEECNRKKGGNLV